MAIAVGCLYVSHYVLGFTSLLADNVATNGVGLVLGTAFRFTFYRLWVFRGDPIVEGDPTIEDDLAGTPASRLV